MWKDIYFKLYIFSTTVQYYSITTVLQLVCTLYRTDIFTPATDSSQEPRIEELTVDEIMNGIPGTDYQVLYCTTVYSNHTYHLDRRGFCKRGKLNSNLVPFIWWKRRAGYWQLGWLIVSKPCLAFKNINSAKFEKGKLRL